MVPALPGEYAVTINFRLKEGHLVGQKGHESPLDRGVIAVVHSIPNKKGHAVYRYATTHNIGVRGEISNVLFSDANGGRLPTAIAENAKGR